MTPARAAFLGGLLSGLLVGPPTFYLIFMHAPRPH